MSESGKETGEAIWTEADQARADLIAEIACEISENEDVVAMALDAYDARRGGAEAALYALLSNCRDAIASLDEGDLGYGEPGDGSRYPIRDEFLASIDAALLPSNTGGTGNG